MQRALVIVDHGSRRREAHLHLEEVAERIRARAAGLRVYIGHMDLAAPSLEEAIEAAVGEGAREVVVHPLFLAPGRHLSEDIPALVERARARHPSVEVRVTEALGSVPGLVDLILGTL